MFGEKHLHKDGFGQVEEYDNSIYNGDFLPTFGRFAGTGHGLARGPDESLKGGRPAIFGSYHPSICQFVFGDGHVTALSTSIDPITLDRLANRDDGQIITETLN